MAEQSTDSIPQQLVSKGLRHSLRAGGSLFAIGCLLASATAQAQDDPAAIRTAVQLAYAERGALTIQYFSPNSGETTTRTIEPVMLYSRNGAEYVEAWCQREDDTRTFRLDRILRVLPT